MANQPLLSLFYRLRQAGFRHLYLDDYQRLIEAWRDGFGWENQESLGELCKLLWVKSFEQERIFDDYFNQFIADFSISKPSQLTEKSPAIHSITQSDIPIVDDNPPNQDNYENNQEAETVSFEPIQAIATGKIPQKIVQSQEKESRNKLQYKTHYLPPSIQQIQQGWQNLHYNIERGSLTEVDLDQTIANIERQGKFFDLALVPHHQKRLEVLLLLDQYGSMVPFQLFSRQLTETASRGGQIRRINSYYFHNLPQEEVYGDAGFQHPENTSQLLFNLQPQSTIVLIFSDAGAARRGFNPSRVTATQEFINQLKPRCRSLVWLNPVPQNLWSKTTAAKIAKFVNMFEFSKQGWEKAITYLQASGGKN